jgi:hypothetical protein
VCRRGEGNADRQEGSCDRSLPCLEQGNRMIEGREALLRSNYW